MSKKLITFGLLGIVVFGISLQANAADLNVDGMNMVIPNTWIEAANEIGDDGAVNITYVCGSGGLNIFTSPYSEDMADFSYILLDASLAGIEQMDGYEEYESGEVEINGKDAHATTFLCGENMGMLVSVDTGTSIANFLYLCPIAVENELDEFGELVDGITFDEASANAKSYSNYTQYSAGVYKVGVDIPAGEYVVFASGGMGYFCVSSDSNQNDILFNDNFDYNSIISINDGEYLDLSRAYAISIEESPDVEIDATGMFKVGTHIPAGEYKLESTDGLGYYCIYPDSRQDDIIANDNFEGQNYVTVSDGQYLVLSRCKFTNPPEKPIKSYSDADTAKKVQEALNAAGYDCGTPDGIIGSGTKGQIEQYQSDNGLTVTGTITDEVLKSLGL